VTDTTRQPALFVENIYDALKAIVSILGGPKTVGKVLWPQKSVDDARALLLHCLDANRPEKLDPDQVVLLFRLARDSGFHVAKHWLDAETGYAPSAPIDPADEEARQFAIVENASKELKRALDTIERMRERGRPLPRVA